MSRGFTLAFISLGIMLAIFFAAFPLGTSRVAQLFFDPERAKFPLSIDYEWNLVRRIANWVPFLLLFPRRFVAPAQARLS